MNEWVMRHIWMSHVTRMNATYGWFMPHIWWYSSFVQKWAIHITYVNEPVMSHVWTSHVSHMDESCHTYGWVMSHIWMSHVTHMNESCHTYGWVMSHVWMSHVTHMNSIILSFVHTSEEISTNFGQIDCSDPASQQVDTLIYLHISICIQQHTATHCNTLQHTATHYNTLQHTATHCNTLPHTATHCNTNFPGYFHLSIDLYFYTATHCNIL